VTFLTIGRKAGLFVIWIGRSVEIFQVTAGAIISNALKCERRRRLVALCTIQGFVYAGQRETIVLVQVGDIVYDPVVGSMATCAIRTHRLLVHISVAGNTVRIGFRKNKGGVTSPAIHIFMLAFELKICFAVVEANRVKTDYHPGHLGDSGFLRIKVLPEFSLNFPTRRIVAGNATDAQVSAMRILGEKVRGEQQ